MSVGMDPVDREEKVGESALREGKADLADRHQCRGRAEGVRVRRLRRIQFRYRCRFQYRLRVPYRHRVLFRCVRGL